VQATIEELREYITKEPLRPIFDKVRAQIRSLGVGIEEYTTSRYLGFRYKGRQLGWLKPNRASFDIYANIIDEKSRLVDTSGVRIESGNEDYRLAFSPSRNLVHRL
jgi:predicted transport protein